MPNFHQLVDSDPDRSPCLGRAEHAFVVDLEVLILCAWVFFGHMDDIRKLFHGDTPSISAICLESSATLRALILLVAAVTSVWSRSASSTSPNSVRRTKS